VRSKVSTPSHLAVNQASPEQLAAKAVKRGMSPEEYKENMLVDEWGDNLVIALLAAVFEKPIVVVTARTLRTFGPTGESEGTPKTMDAVWVAYNEIDHYYGVVNIADRVCSRAPKPKR
jgi:hypothetical protein